MDDWTRHEAGAIIELAVRGDVLWMRGGHGTVDRQLIRAPVPLTFGGEDAVTLSGASARIALVAPAYPSPIFFASLWRPLALDPSANPRSPS